MQYRGLQKSFFILGLSNYLLFIFLIIYFNQTKKEEKWDGQKNIQMVVA